MRAPSGPTCSSRFPAPRKASRPSKRRSSRASRQCNAAVLHDQYLACAEAYLRGVERRIEPGLNPDVPSVASLFVSRWDTAVAAKVPEAMQNQLGIAVGKQTYKAYRYFLGSDRWQRALNFGARPQRLLLASTGTKDPKASDIITSRHWPRRSR